MAAAPNIKVNTIFEEIPDHEVPGIFSQIYKRSISMVGRCENGVGLVFHPKGPQDNFLLIEGVYRSLPSIITETTASFSFVLNDNKYLFKARLVPKNSREGGLLLLTSLFRIQRRSVKRLKIPIDFYAILRLTHINSRMVKNFAKLADISPKGLGLLIPSETSKIKVGDCINVVLSLRQRPPEHIELKVIHRQVVAKESQASLSASETVFLGCLFIPEKSPLVARKMNNIVMDIYRDLFGSLFTES